MRLNAGRAADYLRSKARKGKTKDEELWALLDVEHNAALEMRRGFEALWIIHLAYLQSKQYTVFNATAHQLKDLIRRPGEKRVVDNQMLPKWKRQIADLIKNDPEMSVVPNSQDEEDLKAAKIGDKFLKFWWRGAHMKRTLRMAAAWIYGTGNVFLEDRWDTRLGPQMLNPESGVLEYEGDVACGLWSPFDVLVPVQGLFVGVLDDLPWVETCKWRTFNWMRSNFPKAKKSIGEIQPEDPPLEQAIPSLVFNTKAQTNRSKLSEGAFVREFKVQPCEEFPKGLHYYGSKGQTLWKEDYPFTHYPITHLKDIEVPGCFWGSATGEHAIQLQNRWNRTSNAIDTFNEVMGKGKWVAPKGANMESDPNDEHGEIITYTPQLGHKPEHVTIKSLPQTFTVILEVTRASFENLYSQHEVTRGTNKSDIRSGEMVQILREQDAHGNIPSHMVFEEGMEQFAGRVLKRIQDGYTTPRMITIPGKDAQWEVLKFKGADLRNNNDVFVKRQSSLPDSRAAREARVLERFEKGIYGDPQNPEVRRQVMNMLEDGLVELSFEDVRLDETVARNENMMLMTQQVDRIIVNPYDNHRIHLQIHNAHRKSFDYQRIKYDDPKMFRILEMRFEQMSQQHQKFVMEEEQRLLEREKYLKGGEK